MSLSNVFKGAAFAQETDEVFLVLLTINHVSFTEPIRVVNNTETITSRGNAFTAYPFQVTLPDEDDQKQPQVRLSIQNASQEIMAAIRNAGLDDITVVVEVVRAAAPDTLEIALPQFLLRNVQADVASISGDLVLEDLTKEGFPTGRFTPAYFPGLF